MISLFCPHFHRCSGCSLCNNLEKPPTFIEAQNFFFERGFVDFTLHTGSPTGWRCRAKLAARGTTQKPLLGLFEEGTHHIVDIPQCQVHHPSINHAAELLRLWIKEERIDLYEESTGTGFLRYVQLSVERKTKRVQVVLVINRQGDQEDQKGLKRLWLRGEGLWHSLWVNYNVRRDNVIFGENWFLSEGEEWLKETLAGVDVFFHPASFIQANLDMFEQLLVYVKSHVQDGADLVEYYAGAGVIGASLAKRCRRVRCVEVNEQAKQSFDVMKEALPREISDKISFLCARGASSLQLLEDNPDIVIVDPPRKGLEQELLNALCRHQEACRLIYISCGWKSFQRDCDRLLESGWSLSKATSFLFFPGSDHIEVVAVFDR